MTEIGADTSVLSPEGDVVDLVKKFRVWEVSLVMTGSCMLSCLGG